jgi:hypothetical protein
MPRLVVRMCPVADIRVHYNFFPFNVQPSASNGELSSNRTINTLFYDSTRMRFHSGKQGIITQACALDSIECEWESGGTFGPFVRRQLPA